MGEPKSFGKNWFKPSKESRKKIILSDDDQKELDWWCRHYKESASYLCWRIMEYLEAKDSGDLDRMKSVEGIIRADLPYFWEETLK